MVRRRMSIAVLFALVISLCIPIINGCDCDKDEKKDTATQVAKDWTAESVLTIADEITNLATGLAPGVSGIPGVGDLLFTTIVQQIADNVTWTYSTPEKLSDNIYKVVAKASSEIDLPLVGNYEVSVDFQLTIDTVNREVTDWSVDTDSFNFSEKKSE